MLIQERGFGVYIGKCTNCGNESEEYMLSDFSYGEKLLLTEDGKDFAYLNCFEDKTFNQIGDIADTLCKERNYSAVQIAEIVDIAFGLTCDPVYGKKIDTRRIQRTCKKCETGHVKIGAGPIKAGRVSIPIVTHTSWEQLSSYEQMKVIEDCIKSIQSHG